MKLFLILPIALITGASALPLHNPRNVNSMYNLVHRDSLGHGAGCNDSIGIFRYDNRWNTFGHRLPRPPKASDSATTFGYFTDFSKKKFAYGIPWNNVIYETVSNDGIVIQNSLPKGAGYIDPSGNEFGYRIFWSRVINETSAAVNLTVTFPAAILPSPDDYLKVFIPSDTMSLDKMLLYDYGATGLKSFLDTSIDQPTMLRKTIAPKDDCIFYVVVLGNNDNGVFRAGLSLKGRNLFYNMVSTKPGLGTVAIPCGQILIEK